MSSIQPLICVCVCHSELTELLAEFTELAAELCEFSPLKQYSRNWKSKFLYRYRPEGIFRILFRPDSGPPPLHMLLQRKKANSFVPAIFFPMAWPFRKRRGGLVPVYVFIFPVETVFRPFHNFPCRAIPRSVASQCYSCEPPDRPQSPDTPKVHLRVAIPPAWCPTGCFRGPKGPGDTPSDTLSDTPHFRGHSLGHSGDTSERLL